MRSLKGTTMKVEPIRSVPDIQKIKKMLANHARNYAIFVLGVNTALRASDICRLTRDQVRHMKPGDQLNVKMKKTKKNIEIVCNEDVIAALKPLLIPGDGPLFMAERSGRQLDEKYLCRLVKTWCADVRLKGRYGAHTLRKTWGYIQRTVFKTDWPTISKCYGHSSQEETMSYLCIQPEEVTQAFMNRIG